MSIGLLAAGALLACTALAAGSGTPKTRSGKPAQLVASGLGVPTGFAFGAGHVFMSDGTPPDAAPLGGVYVIRHGHAIKLPGSPPQSFGVVWHKGTLYVSAGTKLQAWKGWNGTTFTKHKTIYKGPKGFPGFNGLAFGPDGRLYSGVDVGNNDHGPATAPYQYDVLSISPSGKHLKVFAKGMRQPWQIAFRGHSSSPFVTDLGQDAGPGAARAPDFLRRVREGDNFGFPKCNWTRAKACKNFDRPFKKFAPHSDTMGVAIVGKRIYISEYGGSTRARVISLPVAGGKARVELSGFPAHRNIVGLGAHRGWIYVGEIGSDLQHLGAVYRFHVATTHARRRPKFTG